MVRPQDIVWLLLFGTLVLTTEDGDPSEIGLLVLLAAAQIVESKASGLASTRGRILWILLKLGLAYLLIGYTGGLESRYWLVLLLPVVSAATNLGVVATLLFSLVASLAYLSFVLFIDWTRFTVEINELTLRVIFLAMAGNLTNTLAQELRERSEQYRRTAEELGRAAARIEVAEEAVRRSDRLAALGQLSAGLAHELRNPLGTIKASSDMLGKTLTAENDVAREVAGFIGSEVERCNSLITRFLQFARPLELRVEKADLTATVDRSIAMVVREAPNVAIYKNYAPETPPFVFDSELLERVVYNLVLNAAQATPAGGAVTVKIRADGKTAEVAVIDRGEGIEPKNLTNIFNPFFTTKPEGVGLGLAIVAKIVDEHGGKITVDSEPGKGSIFRVLLPMDRLATDGRPPASA
jgi:two-component system sensor histidine kinase HydH